MTSRPTALALVLAALGAWALLLAVAVDRVELVIVAAPLLGTLLLGRTSLPPARFTLSYALSSDRALEDDHVAVTATVTAVTALPLIEILHPLPATLALAAGSNRAAFSLRAGESATWTFDIRCLARGHAVLGRFHIRHWHPSGLRAAETRHDDPRRLSVYPLASPIHSLPRPLRTRSSFGNHVSARLGDGLEPGGIRPYVPGDRLRQVNWRTSLRLGRLYVTEFHEERNADIILLLDNTVDVGAQPRSSLDHCVKAAATLALAYLAHRDRVGLVTYGGNVHWIRPAAGRRQVEILLEALLPTGMAGNYSFQGLEALPPRVLPAGALIIALSPLMDARFVRLVANLAERRFDVVVLALSPLELMRPFVASSPVSELAARLWRLERRHAVEDLRERGVAAVVLQPGEPLDAVLAPLARSGRRAAIR